MQNYSKPSVTDLGTLRQLTQIGCHPGLDIGAIVGIAGSDGYQNCGSDRS